MVAIDRAEVAGLRGIIYVEPRGLQDYTDDRLMSWEDFIALGVSTARPTPARSSDAWTPPNPGT